MEPKELLDPFRSRLQHRLKHDQSSVERREWYATMQQPVFQQYKGLEDMRTQVQQIEEQANAKRLREQAISAEAGSKDVVPPVAAPKHFTWLAPLRQSPGPPALVLICFPDIGCNHMLFHDLTQHLTPLPIHIYGVALPGRMHRLLESPKVKLTEILAGLREDIAKLDSPSQLVFLGHGLGAILAFELIRILQVDDLATVAQLIVCASKSPIVLSTETIERRKPWGTKIPPVLGKALLNQSIQEGGVSHVDLALRKDLLRACISTLEADSHLRLEYICLPPLVNAIPIASQLADGFPPEDCTETLKSMGEALYRIRSSIAVFHGIVPQEQLEEYSTAWDGLTQGSFDYWPLETQGHYLLNDEESRQQIQSLFERLLGQPGGESEEVSRVALDEEDSQTS